MTNTTRILSYIAVSIIAANTYLSTQTFMPEWAVGMMGLASVLAIVAREELKPTQIKEIEKKAVEIKPDAIQPKSDNPT